VRKSILYRCTAMILIAGMTVLTTSCVAERNGGSGSRDAEDTTLTAAIRNEVTTLDPSQASYLQVDTAVAPLYDTLTTYDSKGDLVGSLAKEFTYNDDATALTVTLRDDVLFHDGTPLTAGDVAYSLDRNVAIGKGIITQIPSYDSAEVTGDHTLVIRLKQPDALFSAMLSRIYILNSSLVRRHEGNDHAQSWLLSHEAGSGRYSLAQKSAGTFTLDRNNNYFSFDDRRPGTLVLRRIDDLAAARDELAVGSVDAAQINPVDEDAVSAAGGRIADGNTSEAMVWLNNSHGETSDPAVRKALGLAYNYRGGLEKIRFGAGSSAQTVLPNGLSCAADLPSKEQNLAEAKKILSDAGKSNLSLTLRYQPAFEEQVQEATLLQSDLRSIGVTLKLEPIAFADYLTTLTDWNKLPEMMLAGEGLPVPDPGVMLSQVYRSTADGTNKAAYSSPRVDQLLDALDRTPDKADQCDLVKKIETTLNDDSAAMPLYTFNTRVGLGKHVADDGTPFPLTPSGQYDYADLHVSE
jgi:peptide/nickel transport system substrate-binding protein